MQVFKLYFKILKRGIIVSLILYVLLFGMLTIMFTKFAKSPSEEAFNIEKCNVAVIDKDKSKLSNGITEYIKKNSTFAEIEDTSENGLKDAIFFRYAEYIIIIPENFEENFFTDDKMKLETMRVPNSSSGMLLDTMTDKYLNTVEIYSDILASSNNTALIENIGEAIEKTDKSLLAETKIKFEDSGKRKDMPGFAYYFNYFAYPIIAIMVLCVSGIMIIINNLNIKRRNLCSPISISSFNMQLFAANIILSVGVFMVFLLYAVILNGKSIFSLSGALIVLNAFIFTIVSLSLCFLISNIAKGKSVSAISNLLSLGGCFLGGVFVPQEILSETVKNVASINPVFWYVKANNLFASINTFNYETLKPAIFAIAVEICFAVAFLAISLVVIKQKRTQEN